MCYDMDWLRVIVFAIFYHIDILLIVNGDFIVKGYKSDILQNLMFLVMLLVK
jgi:hypothetical protein